MANDWLHPSSREFVLPAGRGLFNRKDDEMNRLGIAVLFGAIVGAPASAQLTWFNDQGEFEAAAAAAGSTLSGVEDYEASIMAPNSVDGFDDSLEFGIPNGPDGFPYPSGTDGLAALTTQSNNLGAFGDDESPGGPNGLAAASNGFLGITTDAMLSNTFVNGMDLIFSGDNNAAVGGRVVDALGSQTGVEITIYDINNNLLGQMHVAGDAGGSNFTGVISTTPIGRVNMFSDGAEGMDDIQLWVAGDSCPADLDGDGDADADDFFAYLDAFAAGNFDVCDIDGDGDCDADDFFGYLDLFAQGC